jgi:hypothetical protein
MGVPPVSGMRARICEQLRGQDLAFRLSIVAFAGNRDTGEPPMIPQARQTSGIILGPSCQCVLRQLSFFLSQRETSVPRFTSNG